VRPVFSFAKMRFTPLKSLGNLILMTLICLVIFWIFMALRPAKAATVLWPEVPPTVLFTEPGGILVDHVKRWIDLAASGQDVEIYGPCYSACTLITAYVPKERLCFAKFSSLNFHQVTYMGHPTVPAAQYTEWMFNRYPEDIRAWLNKRGGIEKLPLTGLTHEWWILWANELWEMGYRKCEKETPAIVPMTIYKRE